jgi:hypothetical protein
MEHCMVLHISQSKLLERPKCKSKSQNNERRKIGVHSLIHNTLGVNGACSNFGMGSKMNDKRVNYSYGPTQVKQQIV